MVGYSVQNRHIEKLPEIHKPNPNRHKRYVIQDSIIGWADAVKTLLKAYTGKLSYTPLFDFSDIREKGALLITAGKRNCPFIQQCMSKNLVNSWKLFIIVVY